MATSSTTHQDYYDALGVPRTASAKEIKTAFRKQARKYHPDVNPGDRVAEARFKEINQANEVLSDPEKRKKYDQFGPDWERHQAWEKAGRPGKGPGSDPFAPGPQVRYQTVSTGDFEELFGRQGFGDVFSSMFADGGVQSGAGGGPRPRGFRANAATRGEDIEGSTEISLEEAYSATTRTVEVATPSGIRKVEVKIPAGIRDGARVRAVGQGAAGAGGGAAGHLFIRVRVRPHPRFTREGDNLSTAVKLPLKVAITGGEVEVPTPSGRRVSLKIPRETQNGKVLRLRGLGMPKLRGGGHGDLLAEVEVELPVPADPELKRWAAGADDDIA